ncbi:hypothetical protein [Parabacteroides sp. AM08-6]|uniref:hypothetical protein n=1 Tax=Parabacteroides sp. AM08-6 TaxID=2292053 RepID=UPI0011C3AF7C|nr:hypothetical protein [Parabacteroides sp. AM08-6]
MRNVICTVSFILLFLSCQNKSQKILAITETNTWSDTVNYRLATAEEARKLLVVEDHYIRNRSPFDIASRLENPEGKKEDLMKLMTEEVRDWTDKEKTQIDQLRTAINDSIRKHQYHLQFPKEIILVKSTLKDEGEAGGYTRKNFIVLMGGDIRQTLLLHETFHVLTRNNPEFKKKMYETIGFTVTPEELEYPKDLWDMRISNPDSERFDSYATFTIDGKQQKCAMVLYANRPYTTGKFFHYITIGMVPLDEQLKPIQENGKTIVYPLEKVSDFYEKVGRNTGYIIQPEEILADNFVIAFLNYPKVPTPELKDKIRNLLKQSPK